jgi:HD-like signal output (HDOD) protein
VGKIVMAWGFPEHFAEIHRQATPGKQDLIELEQQILGVDHAELGALYLQRHRLPEVLVKSARYHHQPEKAGDHRMIVAAVQIADLLMRHAKIGCSGNFVEITRDHFLEATGWHVLFPEEHEAEQAIARAALDRSLERLPSVLEGLV